MSEVTLKAITDDTIRAMVKSRTTGAPLVLDDMPPAEIAIAVERYVSQEGIGPDVFKDKRSGEAYGRVQTAMSTAPADGELLFPLGKVVMTRGALTALSAGQRSEAEGALLARPMLARHQRGDWGDMDPEDCRTNKAALKNGQRLMSAYTIDSEKFWVITEWDRSITTVLLPDEY